MGTALVWGPTGAFAKMISSSGVSQVSVVCYRAVIVAVTVGGWRLVKRGVAAFRASGELLFLYFSLGLLTIFMSTGFMMSCVYLSVPQVLMLGYTSPIVTMAGSAFLTGERPTPTQVLSAFMVLAGLYVGFVMGKTGVGPLSITGVAWGCLSVIGSSGQVLLSRRISKEGNPDSLLQLFFSHLFGGVVLIAAKSFFDGWSDLEGLSARALLLVQYPALMSGLLGYGLLFTSLKYIPASMASLICTLEIVFALMLTPLLVQQVPTAHEVLGCMIIFFAVACSVAGLKFPFARASAG